MQLSPGDLVWVVKEPDKVWVDPKTGYVQQKNNGIKYRAVVLSIHPKTIKVKVFGDNGKSAVLRVNPLKLKPREVE